MEKTVNIIGLGWSAADAPWANYGSEHEEFWGINCAYIYGKLNRVFWLHHPELISGTLRIGKDTLTIPQIVDNFPDMKIYTLTELNIEQNKNSKKVFFNLDPDKVSEENTVLKKTIKYPRDDASLLMHGYYFTNSFPYLIALAILEGFKRIRIYGMEAFSGISEGEYKFERQGIQDWVMFAKGAGVKVDIPFLNMITASNGTNNIYGYNKEHYGSKNVNTL